MVHDPSPEARCTSPFAQRRVKIPAGLEACSTISKAVLPFQQRRFLIFLGCIVCHRRSTGVSNQHRGRLWQASMMARTWHGRALVRNDGRHKAHESNDMQHPPPRPSTRLRAVGRLPSLTRVSSLHRRCNSLKNCLTSTQWKLRGPASRRARDPAGACDFRAAELPRGSSSCSASADWSMRDRTAGRLVEAFGR